MSGVSDILLIPRQHRAQWGKGPYLWWSLSIQPEGKMREGDDEIWPRISSPQLILPSECPSPSVHLLKHNVTALWARGPVQSPLSGALSLKVLLHHLRAVKKAGSQSPPWIHWTRILIFMILESECTYEFGKRWFRCSFLWMRVRPWTPKKYNLGSFPLTFMRVGIGENNSSPIRFQRDLGIHLILLPHIADDESKTQRHNMISKEKSKDQNQDIYSQIQCAPHRAEESQLKCPWMSRWQKWNREDEQPQHCRFCGVPQKCYRADHLCSPLWSLPF